MSGFYSCNGDFEDDTLQGLVSRMAKYYDTDPTPEITSLFWMSNGDNEIEISDLGKHQFYMHLDKMLEINRVEYCRNHKGGY